jgi:hypothetical protein
MTQEDKQLLLADLCARLPYGVKAQVCGWDEEKGEVEVPLKVYSINTDGYLSFEYNHYSVETVYVEDCRLYLRPMSSMTEEETEEYRRLQSDIWKPCGTMYYDTADSIDWLNAHHFDYHYVSGRGYLIDAGLALEAPEGMYD